MAATNPSRVALVGLTAKANGFTWLNSIHLPYIRAHPKHFKIVAIQGSSLQAAQAAVEKFELPSSVATYGNPESLAQDGSVDFVVYALPVQVHYETLEPLFKSRISNYFIEWPVAVSPQQSYALLDIASAGGSKICFGLQGAFTKVSTRLAEVIRSGIIGDVRSSNLVGVIPPAFPSKSVAERHGGSTMLDIYMPQFLASFLEIFGPIESLNCSTSILEPTAVIFNNNTKEVIDPAYPRSAPDHALIHARLASGAVATWNLRFGSCLTGGLKWVIYGSKGEIEITNNLSFCTWINIPGFPHRLRVVDADRKIVVDEEIKEVENGQIAIERLWDAFSSGQEEGVYGIEKARTMVNIVDALWTSSEDGGKEVKVSKS